mmetsp:Transcript_11950/g.19301  ORF Transcript_11950/g.19301 Transcript_11950/m.19301 type:complete len:128 (-) Transcript_11950:5-388(-)
MQEDKVCARKPRVLVGACGSVAVVKVPEIATRLSSEFNADVKIVWTGNACRFNEAAQNYNAKTTDSLKELVENGTIDSLQDEDEWHYQHVGKDPVVHIEVSLVSLGVVLSVSCWVESRVFRTKSRSK